MSLRTEHVLLADIGGTNARFALGRRDATMPLLEGSVRNYVVADFKSLDEAARRYLDESGATVTQGVFAVAGRVERGEARITNHPWLISRSRLSDRLGLSRVQLINDFVAQAMAIPLLRAQDIALVGGAVWHPGTDHRNRTYAVIGPGTGLGMGALFVRDGHRHALESEGGHASFAPETPEELTILDRLSRQFGRVSRERLICGPGLVNIHRALSEIAGEDPQPLRPRDITSRAEAGDARAMRTVDIFCALFGAAAGDLVLTLGAWDGIFLAGGLVPRMLDTLRHSGFRQRFEHKGRFSPNMAAVPTVAVMHPHAGLLGAAAVAGEPVGGASR